MPNDRKKPVEKKKTAKKPPVDYKKLLLSKGVVAATLFLLAIMLITSMFVKNALFINWLATIVRCLVGIGYYFVPLVFLFVSGCLLLSEKYKVTSKIIITSVAPVLFGILGHLFAFSEPYGFKILTDIISDENYKNSGGIISGSIAEILWLLLGRGLAIVIVIIAITVLVFLFLKINFKDFFVDNFEKNKEKLAKSRQERIEQKEKKQHAYVPPVSELKPEKKPSLFPTRSNLQNCEEEDEDDIFIAGIDDNDQNDEDKRSAAEKSDEIAAEVNEIENEVIESESALELEYSYPPIDLLTADTQPNQADGADEVRQNAQTLIETLANFNIDAKITHVTRGPSITRYELQLSKGIKYAKLTALSDDIAIALATQSVRFAPIPDKVAVGIEVPNKIVNTVYIRDILSSNEFSNNKSSVAFALGKDITGKPVVGDIAKLPHMLIAGTTGSGKSVCVNSLLVSLLYKASPEQVRLIMIDPKIIELGVYNGIPHLLIPVVTDPKKAAGALQWAVYEMMQRYKKFAERSMRNIFDYNAEMDRLGTPGEKMPQIVIVIDELADLMIVAKKEVEESICRIAQMARAAGMHLIIATQRPSADVITGLMKANIPSRIAFAVASQLESRIILDSMGAEKLIGKGDMLFNPIGSTKPQRIQGCFISSSEVEAIVEFIKHGHESEYNSEVAAHIEKVTAESQRGKQLPFENDDSEESSFEDSADHLFMQAVDIVIEAGQASTSNLQRRLRLGFSRASSLIDDMERCGYIGPFEGSRPRAVLITKDEWLEKKAGL